MRAPPPEAHEGAPDTAPLRARHLRLGWWLISVFGLLGLVLESLHGFKVPWYLSMATEARRLTWTLAHTHGTLLGLVNVGFAATLHALPQVRATKRLTLAARGLSVSSVMMPVGFFLGGWGIHEGDPGLGVWLVPVAGVVLVASTFVFAFELKR